MSAEAKAAEATVEVPADAVPKPEVPLIDAFRKSLEGAKRNLDPTMVDERGHLLGLLRSAYRITVDAGLVREIQGVLSHAAHTVERNLDVVRLPYGPATWVEIDDNARRPAPDARPSRVGFLIWPDPADPTVLVAAVARQMPELVDGNCHLMPAFCAISLNSFSDSSYRARRFYSRVPVEAVARMSMEIRAFVPRGLLPEIAEIGKHIRGFDLDKVVLDLTLETGGEGVFMLAALLALQASNVVLEETGPGRSVARLGAPAESAWDRFKVRFSSDGKHGFRRGPSRTDPTVRLFPADGGAA